MMTVYNIEIDNSAIKTNLQRLLGQIFKLLPMREDNQEWEKPLETIIIELLGLTKLLENQTELLAVVCKLEGLKDSNVEFMEYRRVILEVCNLVDRIQNNVN